MAPYPATPAQAAHIRSRGGAFGGNGGGILEDPRGNSDAAAVTRLLRAFAGELRETNDAGNKNKAATGVAAANYRERGNRQRGSTTRGPIDHEDIALRTGNFRWLALLRVRMRQGPPAGI